MIDPKSHVPIYLQIVEGIRSEIGKGLRRPGESLPSLRALAVELLVNPNTIQRAYEELERQGLISPRRGVGMFVATKCEEATRGPEEAAVLETFRKGIASARAARISTDRITQLFEAALGRARRRAGGQS
ncbi:GntR family transcriptional regulator [Singulisphaera sp. Ch08]|uniref:GntR family transcriptional regulator n=1 Tax=Singulisphaera sp. Ch08 TaxID=3120278 RepID=A0AAU7CKW5_9BACT